jgi:hypothetical protein
MHKQKPLVINPSLFLTWILTSEWAPQTNEMSYNNG